MFSTCNSPGPTFRPVESFWKIAEQPAVTSERVESDEDHQGGSGNQRGRFRFDISCSCMTTAAEAIAQGRQARVEGNFSGARAHYSAAAKIYHDQNDVLAYAHTIRHIADIYVEESNLAQAKPLYEESIELYRTNFSTKVLDLANALRPYALLNEAQGNLDLARKFWEEAKELYSSVRVEAGVSECEEHISKLQRT